MRSSSTSIQEFTVIRKFLKTQILRISRSPFNFWSKMGRLWTVLWFGLLRSRHQQKKTMNHQKSPQKFEISLNSYKKAYKEISNSEGRKRKIRKAISAFPGFTMRFLILLCFLINAISAVKIAIFTFEHSNSQVGQKKGEKFGNVHEL